MRFLFRCEGWYSWPFVLCRTCNRGVKTDEAMAGAGLKRERRLGRARSREEVGSVEGRMGRRGTRDEANELEEVARGAAAGRTGGRDNSRASEGGIRGILAFLQTLQHSSTDLRGHMNSLEVYRRKLERDRDGHEESV